VDAETFAELAEVAAKGQGPRRKPGQPAPRPRMAATVLLIRDDGPSPRVLMGRRSSGHSFMPDLWVFPGGAVDPADARASAQTELRPETAAILNRHLSPGRGRAVGMAALRETFEETGLVLADLSALDVLARAITPPSVGKRFDTWFLTADAAHLAHLEPTSGAELEDLAWLDFDEAIAKPTPFITRAMLRVARDRMADPTLPRPFTRVRHGALRLESL
jgi:8-oxo-dGTP pyrophosphatase MutT (NUDIX family)